MIIKKFDFLEVRRSGKLCVNFHSVAMKDKSYSIRLLAKFEFPARALNKTRFNYPLFASVKEKNVLRIMNQKIKVWVVTILIFYCIASF